MANETLDVVTEGDGNRRSDLVQGTANAFRMDAMSDGTSRVVFDADSFTLQHPTIAGGQPQPMFQATGTGQLLLNGNTRINGDLFVDGAITAANMKNGFSALGMTGGTAALPPGETEWSNLGAPLTLTVANGGGQAFPLIMLRDHATVQNLSGFNQVGAVIIRLLVNGVPVYIHEIFNSVIPPALGANQGMTDCFDVGIVGSTHIFQLQYQHNFNPGLTGTVFAKVMAQMIAR